MDTTPKTFGISSKITIMIVALMVIFSVCIGTFVYKYVEADYFRLIGMKAQAAATSIASALDGQSVLTIIETSEKNEYYEFIEETIIEVGIRMPEIAYAYVLSMQGAYFFVVYGQDDHTLGHTDPIEIWNDAAIRSHTYAEHNYSEPYFLPGYGHYLSGYAPVFCNTDDVIAIVGFDISVDDIIADLADIRNSIILINSILLLVAVAVVFLFTNRNISRPIALLSAASNRISKGETDIEMPYIKTKDEIELLAKDFKRVQIVVNNLKTEISLLAVSAANGDLSKKIDTCKFSGGWGSLAAELNYLLEVMNKQAAIISESNKAKSRFLAAMSHEIRTPMNAIIGISQIQLQKSDLTDEQASALRKIYNSGSHLLEIINDLLDISKIESGKMDIIQAEYDTANFIYETVQLNLVRIGSKPINFILEADENLPSRLIGDELRLRQILNNLLSNAVKYTDRGYVKLSISHTVKENDILLTFVVEDTGQGIKPEDSGKLFSEYQRFNTDINRAVEGTGIGLNITKNLVNLMNGTITVSGEYGRGSIFTVTVKQGAVQCSPIGAEVSEELRKNRYTGAKQNKTAQISREPMPYGKVLVVDDVELNLYVAEELMEPYELNIDMAESGLEAIEKVRNGKIYDIIFMDHMMPYMDGIEATKQIRELGYNGIIIALTANALSGNDEMYKKHGFDGFISKPINIEHLDGVLNKYIRDKYSEKTMDGDGIY